jgi:hypothetical protein
MEGLSRGGGRQRVRSIALLSGTDRKPLELRFAGQLVEQLGAQLYPRVTASVAEMVSNAWDADAENVWITIPFDAKWNETSEIRVIDDGHGMTYEQAQQRYLVVGRNRRRWDGRTSESGRALHGRKGIGKLAAFGTAGRLELTTRRDGETTAFAIDYAELRRLAPTEPYVAQELPDPDPLLDPSGRPLEHGTRLVLTQLRAKRRTGRAEFTRSMARRFALDATDMAVFINKEPLTRFDYDVQVRFPRDGRPPNAIELEVGDDGWGTERIDASELVRARRERIERERLLATTRQPTAQTPTAEAPLVRGHEEASSEEPAAEDLDLAAREDILTLRDDDTVEVRWWVGFTERPITDEEVRGVSILARGKLAQRPFMFELAQGTEGQLLQEYLVGEVQADWLDFGRGADDDLIQSNRDQLQLDNEELQPLLAWGRERLRWAMAEQGRRRRERRAGPDVLGKEIEQAIQRAPSRSRRRFRTLAARIADLTDDNAAVARAVDAVIGSSELGEVQRAHEELRLEGDPDDPETWTLLHRAEEATVDTDAALLEARIDALHQFSAALREPPVEELHRHAATDPWIVSPILSLLPREVLVEQDRMTVVRFASVEPLVRSWILVCFAVEETAPTLPTDIDDGSLVVASSPVDGASVPMTWAAALAGSAAAHATLLRSLRAP